MEHPQLYMARILETFCCIVSLIDDSGDKLDGVLGLSEAGSGIFLETAFAVQYWGSMVPLVGGGICGLTTHELNWRIKLVGLLVVRCSS